MKHQITSVIEKRGKWCVAYVEEIPAPSRKWLELLREGGRHSIYCNPQTKAASGLPRHSEINDYLACKICRDLGIAGPN
jgi:mRNA interferase HicA